MLNHYGHDETEKLLYPPEYDLLMLAPFISLEKASEAVSVIFRAGFTLSATELVEKGGLLITTKLVDTYVVLLMKILLHI